MNNTRRKHLSAIADSLGKMLDEVEKLTLTTMIESNKDDLDGPKNDEEEYKDNMPESLQSSEKYSDAEEAVSQMEAAQELLDEIVDFDLESKLTEAIDAIRSAAGA